jgi:hypothetical protein
MGNSEVGHLNIGGGRVYYQTLPRINKHIEDGSFFKNKAFLETIKELMAILKSPERLKAIIKKEFFVSYLFRNSFLFV